jgi:uncharacterized protein YjbJ (UPF0337 family)
MGSFLIWNDLVRPFVSLNVPILAREGVFLTGSTLDKASGLANEAMGKIKQGLGSAVRSDKLKGEGAAQEAAAAADDRCQAPSWNENMKRFSGIAINNENIVC